MSIQSLTVYLGSGGKAPEMFKEEAQNFGAYLAQNNIRTVYGGMDAGTMGKLANGALSKGGDVLGVIPTSIKDRDFVHKLLLEQGKMIIVDGMWERKKILVDEGDAAIALPGGYGTIDEIFEFLYWGIKGYHNKPIGLLNINNYWTPLIDFIEHICAEGELEKQAMDALFIDDDPIALVQKLEEYSPRHEVKRIKGVETYISYIEESNLEPTQRPIVIEHTNVEEIYRLANALVLKQLNKITRPIGVYDKDRLFEKFKLWVYTAAADRFITPYCPEMAVYAEEREVLQQLIDMHIHVSVDLHEKWDETEKKKPVR